MQTRIAVIAIIVETMDSAKSVNRLLHEYARYDSKLPGEKI